MVSEKRRPVGGRRAAILELFIRSVAERGYDGTNIGDLAAALEISKGTIVHHFTSKDRMLAESHEDYMRRRLAEADGSGRAEISIDLARRQSLRLEPAR